VAQTFAPQTNLRAASLVGLKGAGVDFDFSLLALSGEKVVPEEGVEPTQSKAPADFESAASASSATPGHHRK
jgi:hypothetical protein